VAIVILKQGRDRAVRGGHPWIFSGAIARLNGEAAAGEVVEVHTAGGVSIGCGIWNAATSIAVRMLCHDAPNIDEGFVGRRIDTALGLRALVRDCDTLRLVHGEGDGLPGLVVDRYGSYIVCQFLTAGADVMKGQVVEALVRALAPDGILERSEGNVRKAEGLAPSTGMLHGDPPPSEVEVVEHGRRYLVDLHRGQKTGLFLDQRPNRDLVSELAEGRRVLNLFAYTGGFAIAAAQGGATFVNSVESSAPALALADASWERNGFDATRGTFTRGDVFEYLRGTIEAPELVVIDPPPFARRRVDQRRALAGYKEVNLRALAACAPGALVLTFSCSQHTSVGDFEGVVAAAAGDAGRRVSILRRLGPGLDHPQAIAHTEGRYLKGLLLRV